MLDPNHCIIALPRCLGGLSCSKVNLWSQVCDKFQNCLLFISINSDQSSSFWLRKAVLSRQHAAATTLCLMCSISTLSVGMWNRLRCSEKQICLYCHVLGNSSLCCWAKWNAESILMWSCSHNCQAAPDWRWGNVLNGQLLHTHTNLDFMRKCQKESNCSKHVVEGALIRLNQNPNLRLPKLNLQEKANVVQY